MNTLSLVPRCWLERKFLCVNSGSVSILPQTLPCKMFSPFLQSSLLNHFLPCILLIPRLRRIRTENIGQLLSIRGTVTRTSEVRPELLFGTFKCIDCTQSVKDVEQQFQFTQVLSSSNIHLKIILISPQKKPTTCQNPTCMNRNDFMLDIEKCKFVDWQKVRLQESAEEVPSGAMPRR